MSLPSMHSDASSTSSPSLVAMSRTNSMTSAGGLTEALCAPLDCTLGEVELRNFSTDPVRSVCFVGAGYVGGPTAAVIALQNPRIRVTVVDRDEDRIAKWNSRHLPVHEPGLYDIVRTVRDGTRATAIEIDEITASTAAFSARAPNLHFSSKCDQHISEADIVFLSVNTNTKTSGIGAGMATNMAALESATRSIARSAKPGAIIVEKSTVPCRTAQIVRDTLEVYRPGVPFEILSNPEFLAEGTAIKDLLHPDRILIGALATSSGRAAADALASVYGAWVDQERIVTTNLWSSELAKLVANAMLAQRISSVNTISAVCERTGANVDEVARVIGLDQRLGSRFLKAGIGFGGSCFKKDILSLIYLANSLELPEVGDYWMQVLNINDFQRVRFVKRIVRKLNGTLAGKKIAILGYAFKKDTNDTRESPAIDVVKQLLADLPFEIAIFDPQCSPAKVHAEIKHFCGKDVLKSEGGSVSAYGDAYGALDGATAAVILTDWDQFRYPPLPVPESAFHEGDQLQQVIAKEQLPQSREMKCLEVRERHRGMRATSREPIDYFDPVSRFEVEPSCEVDCADCQREHREDTVAHENVNWTYVSSMMKQPRWVFDGRGVMEVAAMEKLGFRVERIGETASSSRLNNFK